MIRDANAHLIGNTYPSREYIMLKVRGIITIPHPLELAGENIDDLFEINTEFLAKNKNLFDPTIKWHVLAVCDSETRKNLCIPIESIWNGSIINL